MKERLNKGNVRREGKYMRTSRTIFLNLFTVDPKLVPRRGNPFYTLSLVIQLHSVVIAFRFGIHTHWFRISEFEHLIMIRRGL